MFVSVCAQELFFHLGDWEGFSCANEAFADMLVPDTPLQALSDPEYMKSVLSSLPGVDPNDPSIKNAVEEIKGKDEEKKQDKEEEK